MGILFLEVIFEEWYNMGKRKRTDKDNIKKEGENMQTLAKEQGYKGLSLSSKKLKEITIHPKVKDGKLLFDKNNKDHRYIVEEEYYLSGLQYENEKKSVGAPEGNINNNLKVNSVTSPH